MSNREIGIVGLGVMYSNLALNILDKGFSVAGRDRDAERGRDFLERVTRECGSGAGRQATTQSDEFVGALGRPRAILLAVPPGKPVDALLEQLVALLDRKDVVIDGGNSHFADTYRRVRSLATQCIHFMGMGLSGAEAGARHGPGRMPGGKKAGWTENAWHFRGGGCTVRRRPCVTWLGRDWVGHYVKMVHIGIEYGVMELIAQTYDLLRRGLGLDDNVLQQIWQDALRAVACHAARWGIPAPGLMAALAYYDAYRSARLPADLIQAQRDDFGAHEVELLGHEGTVRVHWEEVSQ